MGEGRFSLVLLGGGHDGGLVDHGELAWLEVGVTTEVAVMEGGKKERERVEREKLDKTRGKLRQLRSSKREPNCSCRPGCSRNYVGKPARVAIPRDGEVMSTNRGM